MTRFEAVVGLVDRLRGLPLPEQPRLRTLITAKPPGPDGIGYSEPDIVSEGSRWVDFRMERGSLTSIEPISLSLKEGVWGEAYLILLDGDEPVAFGAVLTPDGVPVTGYLEAATAKIAITLHRRS
ncbi:MAG: hypothetical protein EOP62_22910 [Sphingomonadales bacterium]|nr:MAG: hypothetical protein EOP62_22910 [Sphingomonadales bacterium]